MPALSSWLLAARLRTLPLSISGILVGSGMALLDGFFRWDVFVLAFLSTLGFQILSNFANDYGDGIKGTDNENRVGPARALQGGLLTARQLLWGMVIITIVTVLLVVALIYTAFGVEKLGLSLLFLFLGIAAIIAAVKYTVGKSAYGYRGLGDVFVFIFFGLVAVLGCYFLYAQQLKFVYLLPAITIGLLATAVLHLNNMRDRIEDEKVGKRTLAVIMGATLSKRYHIGVLFTAFVAWVAYLLTLAATPFIWLSLIPFFFLGFHIKRVVILERHQDLDPELKKVALATFVISFLFFFIVLSC